jgi:tRNA (guanine37-N1)-methyltransferase
MRFDVLTLFPDLFESYLAQSLLKKAIDRGLVEVHRWNFRDWAVDKHQSVDDKPYGGGPGMLLCCQPVFDCVEAVQREGQSPGRVVMLTPQGRRLDQALVRELADSPRLVLLCGRYEGFDERIRLGLSPLEVSVGDFVTNGGEVPAMLVIDSVIRLVPGVLGDETIHAPSRISWNAGSRSAGRRPSRENRPVARRGKPGSHANDTDSNGEGTSCSRRVAMQRRRDKTRRLKTIE